MTNRALGFLVLGLLTFVVNPVSVHSQTVAEGVLGKGMSLEQSIESLATSGGNNQVEITLRSGVAISGRIADWLKSESTVRLTQDDGSTSLIKTHEIAAVKIIDPGTAKIALQGYKILREKQDRVLSPLEFKRLVADLSQLKPIRLDLSISEDKLKSEDCRFYAEKVVTAVRAAVLNACSDKIGLEAFGRFENRVGVAAVETAESPEVLSKDGRLTVRFSCERPLDSDFSEQIAESLDKSL